MPLWLLKFIPKKFLLKYWKPILAGIVLITYSIMLNNCAVDRTDSKWQLKEAERVRVEQIAKDEAAAAAARLKKSQDDAIKAAQDKLKAEKEAAEKRAKDARAEAIEQRRQNNESTKKLKALQAASGSGPVALDDGVRDNLNGVQDKVRSRRRP